MKETKAELFGLVTVFISHWSLGKSSNFMCTRILTEDRNLKENSDVNDVFPCWYSHGPQAGASSGTPDRSRAETEPRWRPASPEENREGPRVNGYLGQTLRKNPN